MMQKNESSNTHHTLLLEDRVKMTLGGVKEVSSFTDTAVALITTKGALLIQGKHLSISRLNTDTGELFVNGDVNAVRYSKDKSRGNIFEGLFK